MTGHNGHEDYDSLIPPSDENSCLNAHVCELKDTVARGSPSVAVAHGVAAAGTTRTPRCGHPKPSPCSWLRARHFERNRGGLLKVAAEAMKSRGVLCYSCRLGVRACRHRGGAGARRATLEGKVVPVHDHDPPVRQARHGGLRQESSASETNFVWSVGEPQGRAAVVNGKVKQTCAVGTYMRCARIRRGKRAQSSTLNRGTLEH